MASPSINLDGLTVDLAEHSNVFDVMKLVSSHLREQHVPEAFIEDMFDMVLSTSSYMAAITVIWAMTGIRFEFRGHPFEQIHQGRAN
jgi:hypothetical protein